MSKNALPGERVAISRGRAAGNGPSAIAFGNFPSTRYQGSKRKILPWIHKHLQRLEFNSVLDIFGGTGAVSYLLKRMGKEVIYNDSLRFNFLAGVALIENDNVTLSDEDVAFLLATREEEDYPRFIEQTFKGFYYTNAENRQLDLLCSRITRLASQSNAARVKAAIASYALFQTCLVKRPFNLFHRKNLYLRLADVDRSFGNKRTWDYPIRKHFAEFVEEANGCIFQGSRPCRATNQDALSTDLPTCDLVYIDPPYLSAGTNETADYLRCYHFLEGMCHYDRWQEMIDDSTQNRRLRRTDNPWIEKEKIFDAFDLLFERFKNSILVISYKRFGLPSISTLQRMLRRHGRKVQTHSRHYMYALNHQNGDAQFNREVLLVSE